MLPKLTPLSMESCHCTVGAGCPPAVTVNVAVDPAQIVCVAGFPVTTGGVFTVSVAALLLATPQELVKTARYCLPLSAATVEKVYVAFVAPPTFAKVVPPSVDTCHCTVGAGVPPAAAVKVA